MAWDLKKKIMQIKKKTWVEILSTLMSLSKDAEDTCGQLAYEYSLTSCL